MKKLCIYHGHCTDGFGAAWAVHKKFGEDVEFVAAQYGQEPPAVTDRDVMIVDFSYKRPVIDEMAKRARSILILDHHKSAREDLDGLQEPAGLWADWLAQVDDREEGESNVAAIFDMERSGAGLTWDYFHGHAIRPSLISYIEDRDLWLFQREGTREIHEVIASYPYTFGFFDFISVKCDHDPQSLILEGAGIRRKHLKDIDEMLKLTRSTMTIGGHLVPVANLPYTMASDAGNIMASEPGVPFAATYFETATDRVYSLRSVEGGEDVSVIAKTYGGGGHKHAAGFRTLRTEPV